ncbi:MAG: TRAP transporter substrate-binding protein DctP [Burkholderiaceae bacterium]|nr:TRAP transporter substrate-binding protein DctP [Burkholderiaceae bacterium]MCD8538074.1 TRAP transporter substrate-binding protein DctP [Burkholderiaceae bacterium]MCD8565432.1 TRAP transporter substrate-binding protein DctP [Burkholderiaceae bacterium]
MSIIKKVLNTSFVALVAAVGVAQAQSPVVLKFAHEVPETAIKGKTATMFAQKVNEYSKGTLRVDVFPNAQLMPSRDEVRAAIRGQVDIIAPQTSFFVPLDQSWDVFYQPLLFDTAKQGMDTLKGPVGQEMLGELSRVGLQGMGIWQDGPGYLFMRQTPVTKPEELKGMKVRVFPSAPLEAAVRAPGGIAVSLPAADVFLGLQQGTIEGVITAVTYAGPAKWDEVLKAMTRMTMFIGGYGVVMNKASWDKLSDEHKAVVKRALDEATAWNHEVAAQNIIDNEKQLQANGVKLADLTPEELASWRKLMEPIYKQQPEAVQARIRQIQQLNK